MKSLSTKISAAALIASALLIAACGQPTKFDPAAFNDPSTRQKNASSYWKQDNFWGGMPKDVNKVAITQFSVEYVTENTSKSGADALSVLGVMEMAGVGKRQRVFPDEFKTKLPTPLYEGFVSALKAEGIDVVPMADLQKNPAFGDIKAGEAGSTYGQSGRDFLGHADNRTSVQVQVYPVAGLPLVDDSWFAGGKNAQAEAKLIGDTGAQAGLRVRMRVALDDDGHAILDKGAVINAMYDLKKQNWSGKGDEWVITQRHNIVSSGAVRDDVPVVDGKEFQAFKGDVYTINGPKFEESIMKMYPSFARMAAMRLRSQ